MQLEGNGQIWYRNINTVKPAQPSEGLKMRVAMHNWMRAEPIEVTIARFANRVRRGEIGGEPERTTRGRRQAAEGSSPRVLGIGDAHARRRNRWRPTRGAGPCR